MKIKFLVRGTDLFAAAVLVGLLVFLFHKTPAGFWRHDDPYLLLHALKSPGMSAFFDPEDWQRLSPVHLTPWATFSYKLDLWLFGLSPAFFYVHQLLSLALTALALYALARHALPWLGALAVGVLFLLGAPTASVAEQLMTRHYVEGMVFALFAVIAFLKAERERRLIWAMVGAALYALATTAKETYVPLPLVLLCLPFARQEAGAGVEPVHSLFSFNWRMRMRMLIPYALTALLYVFWRYYMLGYFLGGYLGTKMVWLKGANDAGLLNTLALYSKKIFMAFAKLPELLFGDWWLLPAGLFFLATLFALLRRPVRIFLALALLLALFVPIAPLAIFPGIHAPDRYVFLLWGVFCLLAVWMLWELLRALPSWEKPLCLIRPALGSALFAVLVVPTAIQGASFAKQQQEATRALDVQARFVMENDGRSCFIPSQGGFELTALLCAYVRQGEKFCPQFVFPDVPLEYPCKQVFAYDSAKNSMVEVAEPKPENVDMSRPLRAEMSFSRGLFHWSLGPYTDGEYYFVSSRWGRVGGLPAAVGLAPAAYESLSIHVLYESPEGWKTISPKLTVSRTQPLIWERKALPNEP